MALDPLHIFLKGTATVSSSPAPSKAHSTNASSEHKAKNNHAVNRRESKSKSALTSVGAFRSTTAASTQTPPLSVVAQRLVKGWGF